MDSALIRRFPKLAALPRASFVTAPTPVEPSTAAPDLWVKRDDLTSPAVGGNKVRALEFLLGGAGEGTEVVTVGARGSTHALATAVHGSSIGVRTTVFRWPQEMNDAARRVDARLRESAVVRDALTPPTAILRALLYRASHPVRWIPPGGTSPLGVLGHVDAALELAGQVAAGVLPPPARVLVPLGTGGTAAGLVIGFAIAGLGAEVVGVQVVPRILANRGHVWRLVSRSSRFLAAASGESFRSPGLARFTIERAYYGGAYGRETVAGREADDCYRAAHPGSMLDPTYSAKACAAAIARCDGRPTLLWNTFDSKLLG